MKFNLKSLHQRLGEFGLDPIDWCIEINSMRGTLAKLEICSLRDSGLKFEGWAEDGRWLHLSLCEAWSQSN